MKCKILLLAFSILCTNSVLTQQIAKSTLEDVLLKNATVHTITNGVVENTDVLIRDGEIYDLGQNIQANSVKIIDCSGKHIYPGFIDAGTQVGMIEVNAVSLTNDTREIGDLIPQMQALTAVNPNGTAIPVTRVNGVTSALVKPSGGLFPGTAALINLHGYTPDQMYAGFKGIVLNFPSSSRRSRFDRRTDEDIKKEYEKAAKKLDDVWSRVGLYSKIDSSAQAIGGAKRKYQPEMEALLPAYRGEMTMLIYTNKKEDIKNALSWIEENNVKAVLSGVAEGYLVAEEIANAGVSVITGPVLSIPGRSSDRYDVAYKNAAVMQKAGVKVALRTNDSENVRNLPFNAGFAAAYGMGIEEALKAITINPAEIFGVDDKLGSIEKGKLANLFVSTGDPFEMKTEIQHLFIEGWDVPIESRHTLLYNEFLHRNPGLDR